MYAERPSGLAGAVSWTRAATPDPRTARILPDGCLDLIWSAGRIMVAGPDTTARLVPTPAGVAYAALRFAPGWAPEVLGLPATELRDRQPDLDELWPGEGRRWAERVAAAPDPAVALADLVRAALAGREPDPVIRAVAAGLRRGEPVARVADAVGLTPRQLHRRSLDAFGYGPKTLGRVLRLNRAVALARGGMALAEVAATAGYADQAHLTREVRALAGVTPSGLARAD